MPIQLGVNRESMVEEFHRAFGHPIGMADRSTVALRVSLVKEETKEVEEAAETLLQVNNQENREALLKELCDLQYVLSGFFVTLGWDAEEAFRRVHKSNMSKLGADGKPIYREDGKVLKGPNYKEPDLKDLV